MDKKDLVKCVHINIICKLTGIIRILESGEVGIYSFDFYVKKKKVKKMKKFIMKMLVRYDHPLVDMVCTENVTVYPDKVSTKESIEDDIRLFRGVKIAKN